MTGLATSRKHASTHCMQILPGLIPSPRPPLLIRSIPAPMSAARLSRPRQASRHLSRSMKSDTEAPVHGDWSESQTSVAPPKVFEAVGQGHGAHRARPASRRSAACAASGQAAAPWRMSRNHRYRRHAHRRGMRRRARAAMQWPDATRLSSSGRSNKERSMGNIKFEGSPPYALPIAQYVTARAEGAVVEMTLEVITPGKKPSIVPIKVQMTLDSARSLRAQLQPAITRAEVHQRP